MSGRDVVAYLWWSMWALDMAEATRECFQRKELGALHRFLEERYDPPKRERFYLLLKKLKARGGKIKTVDAACVLLPELADLFRDGRVIDRPARDERTA